MAVSKYETNVKPKLFLVQMWARDGLTDEQIAEKLDISVASFYNYKNEHLEFLESLKKGKEVADYEVENALFKKATGYKVVETIKERIIDSGQKNRHNEQQALTEIEWDMAIKYFGGKCCYCGKPMFPPTKDHIIPLSMGGKLEVKNVLPCCQSCNSSKKDTEMETWFRKQPFYEEEKIQKIYDYIDFATNFNFGDNLVITKEITKEIPPDTTAQIFWLKNRRPDKWRDKQELEQDNTGVLETLVKIRECAIENNRNNRD